MRVYVFCKRNHRFAPTSSKTLYSFESQQRVEIGEFLMICFIYMIIVSHG